MDSLLFTGYNNWLEVWWTNKNARLIADHTIDTVQAKLSQLESQCHFPTAEAGILFAKLARTDLPRHAVQPGLDPVSTSA